MICQDGAGPDGEQGARDMAYIIIDINSDLEPTEYEIDSDDGEAAARVALRDAGLAYEDVWVGESGTADAHKTGSRLFAAVSVRLTLGSDGMGDATEDDFHAWCEYVTAHAERELPGVDVAIGPFGSADSVVGVSEDKDEVYNALARLWEQWCSEGAGIRA